MSSPVSTSISFSFAQESGGLSLDNWNGFVGMGSVALALTDTMPSGRVRLYASVGEVSDFNMDASRNVPASFVEVNGDSFATIPAGADYEIVFALGAAGQDIGKPGVVSRHGNRVTFSSRFWGLIKIKPHTVSFKVLKYTPLKTLSLWTYGQVAAYKNGVLATCAVSPIDRGTGNDELEVYRIESEALINGDGEWEKPIGWPDKPSYANGAKPPRAKVGVITTRIHEVGMVTPTGYFYSRTFHIQNQKPYFGDTTYQPTKKIVQGKGFSSLSDDMKVRAMEAMTARGKANFL